MEDARRTLRTVVPEIVTVTSTFRVPVFMLEKRSMVLLFKGKSGGELG